VALPHLWVAPECPLWEEAHQGQGLCLQAPWVAWVLVALIQTAPTAASPERPWVVQCPWDPPHTP